MTKKTIGKVFQESVGKVMSIVSKHKTESETELSDANQLVSLVRTLRDLEKQLGSKDDVNIKNQMREILGKMSEIMGKNLQTIKKSIERIPEEKNTVEKFNHESKAFDKALEELRQEKKLISDAEKSRKIDLNIFIKWYWAEKQKVRDNILRPEDLKNLVLGKIITHEHSEYRITDYSGPHIYDEINSPDKAADDDSVQLIDRATGLVVKKINPKPTTTTFNRETGEMSTQTHYVESDPYPSVLPIELLKIILEDWENSHRRDKEHRIIDLSLSRLAKNEKVNFTPKLIQLLISSLRSERTTEFEINKNLANKAVIVQRSGGKDGTTINLLTRRYHEGRIFVSDEFEPDRVSPGIPVDEHFIPALDWIAEHFVLEHAVRKLNEKLIAFSIHNCHNIDELLKHVYTEDKNDNYIVRDIAMWQEGGFNHKDAITIIRYRNFKKNKEEKKPEGIVET